METEIHYKLHMAKTYYDGSEWNPKVPPHIAALHEIHPILAILL